LVHRERVLQVARHFWNPFFRIQEYHSSERFKSIRVVVSRIPFQTVMSLTAR
jgi:hypothetical protein